MTEKKTLSFVISKLALAGLFYYNPRWSVLMYFFAMQTVFLIR